MSDPGDRPNVLVILTDQQTAGAMSCAGNRDIRTPALDALAARGVRFARAYCTQPLCTPSRASMWTGRMPTELGVTGNGLGLSEGHSENQLGQLFARTGYDTAYIGKWHVPGQVQESDGFATRFHVAPDPELADAAARYIRTPRDNPFLLVVSLNEPHGICEWARRQTPPPGAVAEPSFSELPDLPANFACGAYEAELPQLARERSPFAHPTAGWSERDWRRYLHAYYRLCEGVDACVDRVLAALSDSDQLDRTVVVFTSDHGDGVAAHQWNQKWALIEESVRVPMIVSAPRAEASVEGTVNTALVSSGLDLVPTVCDYAGISAPDGLRGHSLRTLIEHGDSGPWRTSLVAQTTWATCDGPG